MQVKDLLVTGNVRVLGNLYTKDGPVGGGSAGGGGGGGDSITYRLTKSGSTITLTGSDGSSSSVTDADTNTTYTLSSLGAAPASHTHDDRYYTESEVNNLLNGRAPSSHTHDDRYYTESEVNNLLNDKAPADHEHTTTDITNFPSSLPASDVYSWAKAANKPSYTWEEIVGKPISFTPAGHTHDDRYYTESEVNNLLNDKAPAYQYGTTDLTAGSSELATGILYFVYE